MADEPDVAYRGSATLTVNGRDVPVEAILDARHEPQDGKLHWFGRLVPCGIDEPLAAALVAPRSRVTLRTVGAPAEARIGDIDPWGRYRVTGVGRPPFPLDGP